MENLENLENLRPGNHAENLSGKHGKFTWKIRDAWKISWRKIKWKISGIWKICILAENLENLEIKQRFDYVKKCGKFSQSVFKRNLVENLTLICLENLLKSTCII